MNDFINSLSAREISILIWLIISLSIFILISWKVFLNVLRFLFHYKIISALFIYLIYCSGIIYILFELDYWKLDLLKDTIIWFLSTGIIIFFNVNKIEKTDYFTKIINDNLKIIIFLEFVINFYTFGIITELILVPAITLIVILYEYSKYTMHKNPKHINANKFLQLILSLFTVFIFSYIIYKAFFDYKQLFTNSNIKSLYLPIILTFLSFPFYYFLALIMIYEEFFVRINFMFSSKKIKRQVKKSILINANFNLNKLTKIKNSFEKKQVYKMPIKEYIHSLIK
ncbi:hypothetical protein [Elizabethkingia miricola]|uniref:hypothetical protein n=1 Tax=Elizabethkingia miricola TaxID=172045 RepID=UPI0009994BF7|nr:hypothetical protein [Elizabethkingia miricola]OPC36846.1 hypothetical protein BAX99_17765 [Elizabethkingia miricola]